MARQELDYGQVRRFRILDGDVEVGAPDEYDHEILARLIARTDDPSATWEDLGEGVDHSFTKVYFQEDTGDITAQIVVGGEAADLADARSAFERWASANTISPSIGCLTRACSERYYSAPWSRRL